ncbi:MAG TPA: DUF4350 domain-containing protein [Sedimenticola sp.]|nr:DUF4350 domain-containing protein [Sedimenticola sp.]
MKPAALARWGLLLALAGGLVWWFLGAYEYREREVRGEPAVEARRNPLLAAGRFLRRRGLAVEGVSGRGPLLHPPGRNGLLLVHHAGRSLVPARRKALLDWVRRGGHLVITAGTDTGAGMLQELGVRLQRQAREEGDGCPVAIDYPGFPSRLQIAFDPGRQLFDERLGTEGHHLLRYPRGAGVVTVLSDSAFLTNDAIGEYDHALLLALLAAGQERAWLLYGSGIPPLPALLWQKAPQLVAGVLLLSLLFLWRLTRRSGPSLGEAGEPEPVGIGEHLRVAAACLWRIDRGRDMLRASRHAVEQAWLRRHPALGRLARGERCERIAGLAGLSPAAVERALYGEVAAPQDYTAITRLLQRLLPGQEGQRG